MALRHDETLGRRLRVPALLLALVVAYGIAGFALLGWSVVDAAYMTLITLTTVGFEEVRPVDDTGEKLFTMSLVVLGVTVLLVTLTLVGVWLAEGVLVERRRRRRMEKELESLSDHFVVCAYGRVGRAVARELAAEGAPFVVIDSNEELEPRMIEDGVAYIIGDPSEEPVLRKAGVERARALVCAVDSDATNVFITLMARAINPRIFIVARASESQSVARLKQAGADRVISPYTTSGHHMALMALRPGVVGTLDIEEEPEGGLRLEEVKIEEGSPLVGRSVGEACGRAVLLAVRHPDGSVTPSPRTGMRLRAGDLMLLLGEEDVLRPVEEAERGAVGSAGGGGDGPDGPVEPRAARGR